MAETNTNRVIVSVQDHVAHVRLNRPDKRNGLDLEMFHALIATGEQLIPDRSVRAVVLSGEGPAFCAGLDWKAFMALGSESTSLLERNEKSPANVAQRACWIWTEIPVPVIAAVQGAAFGGGLQLALAADLRYLANDAKMSVMEIRYGLIPDMTLSQTLLKLVRADIAKELVYTGKTIDAATALQLGLATRVCDDPLAQAFETAKQIANSSPDAIRFAKKLLNEAPHLSVAAGLKLETDLQVKLLQSENQMLAVQSVFTGQPASYKDPE